MDEEIQVDATEEPEGLLSGTTPETAEPPEETPAHILEETDALVAPDAVAADAPAERPENIPEKFWKDGQVDVDAMAKSYTELRTKMSQGKHKPPKDGKYDLEDSGLDLDDPIMEKFLDLAREEGLGQDLVRSLTELYKESAGVIEQQIEFKRDEEMAKLGRNADAIIKSMDDWLGRMAGAGVLSEPELQSIASASSSATFISALNKIRRSYNEPAIPSVEVTQPDAITMDDIESMMADERYGADPAYTRKVERMVYEKHGEQPPKFAA